MYNLIELMEIEQNYIYFSQCIDGCGEIIFLSEFCFKVYHRLGKRYARV